MKSNAASMKFKVERVGARRRARKGAMDGQASERNLLDKSASVVSDVAGGPEDKLANDDGTASVGAGAARFACEERDQTE